MKEQIFKRAILNTLLGEGGLFADFSLISKELSEEMNNLGYVIQSDKVLANEIATLLYNRFKFVCAARGIPATFKNLGEVMNTYQCCLCALSSYKEMQQKPKKSKSR